MYFYVLVLLYQNYFSEEQLQNAFHCTRRWVVYESGPDSCDSFSASHLQQYLSSFLESQRGPGGKPHLLVLSPG